MKYTLAILVSFFCVSLCTGTTDDSVLPYGRKPFASFAVDDLSQAHAILLYVVVLEELHTLGFEKPDSMRGSAQAAALFSGIIAASSVLSNQEFRPSPRMKLLGPVEYEWIYDIVEKLSRKARVTVPRIWLSDDLKTNKELNLSAYVASLKPELVLSQDMVSTFTRDELESVIAHEISHIAAYDIHAQVLLESIAKGIYCQFSLLYYYLIRELFQREKRPEELLRQFAVYWAVLTVYFCFLAFVRAYSRYRELCADWDGAELTSNPAASIRALDKIGKNGSYARESGELMFQRLFATHPRIADRLQKLRKMARSLRTKLLSRKKEAPLVCA